MSAKKALLIGCGTVTVLAVILAALIVGWIVYVSQDVEGLSVSIDSPLDVKMGETFTVTVTVSNERKKDFLSLSDIDISDDYLEGFVIVSTEPKPKAIMHVPIDNSMSYTFDTAIPAGESKAYIFSLRAEKIGIYRGDVDACEGLRFVSAMAQTVVR